MYHSRRLFALFLVIFIDSFGFGLVIPIMAHLLIEPNHPFFPDTSAAIRNVIFTTTIALLPLAKLFSHPAIGACSDKWGRKSTMSICLIGSSIGFLLLFIGIVLHWFSLIIIGRLINGFAAGSQPIAQAAVIDCCEQHHKTKRLGIVAFAMTLAMVLGPLLGGLLSDPTILPWFNNTTPFVLAFGLSILNLWLLWRYFEETHQVKQHDHIRWRHIFQTIHQISHMGNIRFILVAFFFYEFAWSLYFQSAPLWLIGQYQLNVTQLAIFLAVIGFWMSLGLTVILSRLVRYFRATTLFLSALTLASSAVLIMCVLPTMTTQWLAIIPLAIATGIAYPCMLTTLSNQTPNMKQGWIMGVASALLAGSWLLSGVLASLFYNFNAHLPLQLTFAGYAIAACLLWRAMRTTNYDKSSTQSI